MGEMTAQPYGSLYGLQVCGDLDFRGWLGPAAPQLPAIQVIRGAPESSPVGAVVVSLARLEARVTPAAIHVWGEALDEDWVAEFTAYRLLPLACELRGSVVLHGAAAALGERAVLLVGDNGSGKSTQVSTLYRRGATFLTDDVAVVDMAEGTARLHPGPPWLRRREAPMADEPAVWHQSASGKYLQPVPRERGAAEGKPLAAVCALTFGREAEPRLERLSPSATAAVLLPQWKNLLLAGLDAAVRLQRIATLVPAVRGYRLVLPTPPMPEATAELLEQLLQAH